jgi:hypothetical protein
MDSEPSSDFQHTGEHLLLALYDGGRLWFRSPFDDANTIGDRAELFAETVGSQDPQAELRLEMGTHSLVLVRGADIDWEELLSALELPVRTMPGRDPEEVWVPPAEAERIEFLLKEARILT